MTRLLVHLHLYYRGQLPWFLEKLANLEEPWDLVVTMPAEDAEAEALIRQLKPDARFLVVENAGYDIWPFIAALRSVDLEDYPLVMKLHTKNRNDSGYTVNGLRLMGFAWRDYLVDALLKTPARARKLRQLMELHPEVGMVCESCLIRRTGALDPADGPLLEAECRRLGISFRHRRFCAGTMFLARTSCFKRLRDSDLTASSFMGETASHVSGSPAHVYERIVSFLPQEEELQLKGVSTHPFRAAWVRVTKAVEPALKQVFALERVGPEGIKQLTLLGMKFKIATFAKYDGN